MISIERIQELSQQCLQRLPTIVLGSGASVPYGIPGMHPLGKHLAASTLPATCVDPADHECWQGFLEAVSKKDLETALMEVSVTPRVLQHVVATTWLFLNSSDLEVFLRVIRDRRHLALSRLYEYLLRSTAQEIHVVTPNYDRIAEYAAEASGFVAYTGFGFGCIGAQERNPPPRVHHGARRVRTVNVWKVHGSFGWFCDEQGVVTALPPMSAVPAGMTPAIVTPGVEKFRRTHDEPFRTTMHCADDAIRQANAFLCVGFGFNDPHIQPLLAERCAKPDVPLILITKQISEAALAFFRAGRCSRYLALECVNGGVRAYCNEAPDGADLVGGEFWQLDKFLDIAI